MTRNNIFKSQEQEDQSEVLFVGTSFTLISQALEKSLRAKNCTIYKKKKIEPKDRLFDYIIFFGAVKKPTNYIKHLNQGAKGLIIMSEQSKHKMYDTDFPIVELSAHETYSIDTILESVEYTLFTQSPIALPEKLLEERKKQQQKKKKEVKKTPPKKKPTNPKKKSRKMGFYIGSVILVLFAVLILPAVLFFGSLAVAGNSVYSLNGQELSQTAREQKIAFSQKALDMTDGVSYILIPVIDFMNPDYANTLSGILELSHAGVNTASELVAVVGMLEQDIPGVLHGDASSFRKNIPDIKDHLSKSELYLSDAISARSDLELLYQAPFIRDQLEPLDSLEEIRDNVQSIRVGLDAVPELLAFDQRKRYLVLFQNSFELRPTGGFIGSYGIITIENGAIKDIIIEDVYEADGQLKGSVEPPAAIEDHLGQPNWFLRDSNWNPDFSLSAKQAEWFLLKEKEIVVDGVIGIDIYAARNLLSALGSVYVPDYEATVTADDFFQKIQYETHDGFFPGSSAKKDLLSALVRTIMINLGDSDSVPHLALFKALGDSLKQKHIVVYSHDRQTQDTIESLGWGGRVLSASDSLTEDTLLDYTMVVDANLGVNKVNYHVEREFFHTIAPRESTLSHEVTIYYANNSSADSEDSLYNGIYKNYVRILIPQNAQLQTLTIDGDALNADDIDIENANGKQTIGFLILVPPESEKQVHIVYTFDIDQTKKSFLYQLLLQKQSGTSNDALIIRTEPESPWNIRASSMPNNPVLESFLTDYVATVDFTR